MAKKYFLLLKNKILIMKIKKALIIKIILQRKKKIKIKKVILNILILDFIPGFVINLII